jgi:NAD-dependent deacetylase
VSPSISATVSEIIRNSRRIVVLSGAGISAESGIPTFRGGDGLWEGHAIEDVATPRGWRKDPELVWRFYHARRATAFAARPNPAHVALAQYESVRTNDVVIVTQNVDGLHTEAGSRRVLEIHGSLRRTRCTGCDHRLDQGLSPLPALPVCERCGALLRPDIVWFEEMLPEDVWAGALMETSRADCLLVVGTSAVVHPACSLIPHAKNHGAVVIEFNLTRTIASDHCDYTIEGPVGATLPPVLFRPTTI